MKGNILPKHDMETYAGRRALLREILYDPDLKLSFREGSIYAYNWFRYELAIIVHEKSCRDRKKYGQRLNQTLAVFALRKNIKDL